MIYKDDTIEFDIPQSLLGKKTIKPKYERLNWCIDTKSLLVDIWLEFGEEKITRQKIANSKTIEGFNISGGCQKTFIHGKEAYYCVDVQIPRVPNGKYVPGCLFSITHENYAVCIEISDYRYGENRFNLDDFLPFISSIKITDIEKYRKLYKKMYQQIDVTGQAPKGYDVVFALPDGIMPKDVSHRKECIKIENDTILIEIYDFTGLGREADMDIYEDEIEIEHNPSIKLLNKGEKKYLIQNQENQKLDLTKCKDISVMIVFQGLCFLIHIKSAKPFDFDKFAAFLDSIKHSV